MVIERSPGEDSVTGTLTKVRGDSEFMMFGALFTFEHRDGTHNLDSAKFFSRIVDAPAELENMRIESVILRIADASPGMKQSDLVNKVRDTMAAAPNGKPPSINKVRGLIDNLVEDGDLIAKVGEKNAKHYYIA